MGMIVQEQDGKIKKTSGSFYRGESVNYHPNDESLKLPNAIDTYMVKGWMPEQGFVTEQTPVVAFGSCFAANISKYLHGRGYNVLTMKDNKSYVTKMGDGIVHTYAIRQQFEWAWENKTPSLDLWHGYKAEDFGYSEDARQDTLKLFNEAEMFIITLGLSEIWYDEPTGEVFWRAVPADRIDPSRHKFRVSTQAETLENLRAIRQLIRTHRGDVPIMISVSPIPLTATFRPVACITANAVSKAVLRCAVDELIREVEDPKLYYFPSYEVVSTAFNHQWTTDRKHVYPHVLDFNMKIFEHYFCTPGLPYAELEKSWRKAARLDKLIGWFGHEAVAQKTAPLTASEKRKLRIDARVRQRLADQMMRKKLATMTPQERKDFKRANRVATRIADRKRAKILARPVAA